MNNEELTVLAEEFRSTDDKTQAYISMDELNQQLRYVRDEAVLEALSKIASAQQMWENLERGETPHETMMDAVDATMRQLRKEHGHVTPLETSPTFALPIRGSMWRHHWAADRPLLTVKVVNGDVFFTDDSSMAVRTFLDAYKYVADAVEPCGTYNCTNLRAMRHIMCSNCSSEYRDDPDAFK